MLPKAISDIDNQSLEELLGLNLDIPHWAFLAGISVDWITKEEQQPIFDRIVHAHISDHEKGHFSDDVIGVIHKEHHFLRWMTDVISKRSRSKSGLNYSGYVSCELEAAKNGDMIRLTVDRCNDLLANRPFTAEGTRPPN